MRVLYCYSRCCVACVFARSFAYRLFLGVRECNRCSGKRVKTLLYSLAYNRYWHCLPPAPLKLRPNGAIQIYYYYYYYQSRDHLTRDTWFTIGSQFEPTIYLVRLSRYTTSKIFGSWHWPFLGLTWRHRSRDYWTRSVLFPMRGLLKPTR